MSIRFVSYARKSSQGDSKQIESIRDQERLLFDLAAHQNLMVTWALSEARSAKQPYTRPVYREMIEMIKAGKADGILCWHLNRLSRNPLESGELQWLLQSGQLKCIKTPEREYHPEDHALLMAVESSMASQYVRDLKRDVERGVREKVKRGWYPYKAKVGYIVDPLTKELKEDPASFKLLRLAWELMLTGAYSVPQVLDNLNGAGYRSPRTKSGGNKPMTRSGLYRLFNDQFYAGYFEFEGARQTGRHPAMVKPDEFRKVQGILKRQSGAAKQDWFHPYAGLIVCGVCGCRVTAETHVKRYKTTGRTVAYTYYHCTGRKGCRKISLTEEDLEAALLERLERCRLDPDFVDWALDVVQRDRTERDTLADTSSTLSSGAEQTLRRRLDRLFDMRENEEITPQEFIERKGRYSRELQALQDVALAANTRAVREADEVVKLLTFSRDWYAKFSKGSWEKRQVACEFAKGYVLTLGKLKPLLTPAMAQICSFEPPKNPVQQVGPGATQLQLYVWRAMLDELRTLVSEDNQ